MKSITKLIIFSVLVFLPAFTLADNGFPSFPMAFWGTATIDGQLLSSGTKIEAFCDNSLIGSVTMTENGIYGYIDSTKIKLLVSSCNDDILFEYLLSNVTDPLTGGSEIKYTDGFQAGTTVNKNLNFITVESCNITNGTGSQTWTEADWGSCNLVSCNSGYTQSGNTCVANSSGGGGGGGGGGGYTPPASTSTTIKGDINKDKKVDKYDFALIMANWGKTGTNTSDLNNDGKVDKYDFALLMLNWSK